MLRSGQVISGLLWARTEMKVGVNNSAKWNVIQRCDQEKM